MNTYYLFINKAYHCAISSDIIPRIGETININNTSYTVVNVVHNVIVEEHRQNKLFNIDVYVK